MLYFVIFAGAIIAFITYSNKRAAEKEEILRRENAARSTARAEDVLTAGGIPKKTELHPSENELKQDTTRREIKVQQEYFSHKATSSIKANAERFHREPLLDSFDPYLHLIIMGGEHISNTLERDLILTPNNCVICRRPTAPDNLRVTLVNGAHVHRVCYEAMCKKVRTWQSFNDIPSPDTKDYPLLDRIMIVNNYWTTYPDDWETRKYIVLKKSDYTCESCGEDSKPLHVHHIQELAAGGSNILRNLICLCEDCHNEIHNGLLSKGIDIKKGKNRTKIDDAINRDRNIEFTYKDTNGNYTRRSAKPLRYIKTPHGAPAIRAFCYLRNEERTFVIRKMSKMKVE